MEIIEDKIRKSISFFSIRNINYSINSVKFSSNDYIYNLNISLISNKNISFYVSFNDQKLFEQKFISPIKASYVFLGNIVFADWFLKKNGKFSWVDFFTTTSIDTSVLIEFLGKNWNYSIPYFIGDNYEPDGIGKLVLETRNSFDGKWQCFYEEKGLITNRMNFHDENIACSFFLGALASEISK